MDEHQGTEAGLQALVATLYAAARCDDASALDALAASCAVDAADAQFFVALVGEAQAAAVARAYEARTRYAEEAPLEQLLSLFGNPKVPPLQLRAIVCGHEAAHEGAARAAERAVPEIEARVTVGYVVAEIEGQGTAELSGDWVFVAGRWRFMGLLRSLAPFAPTLDGLVAAMRFGLLLASAGARAELRAVLAHVVPDVEWFAQAFGEAHARALAAEHAELAPELPGALEGVFHDILESRRDTLRATWAASPYSEDISGLQRAALAAMRANHPLATVTFSDDDGQRPYTLASWTVVDGRWRFLGKMWALQRVEAPEPPPLLAPAARDDAEGLRALLVYATHLAGRNQADELAAVAERMRLPDAAAWFERMVGGPLGAELAAAYAKLGPLDELLRALAQRGVEVEVRRVGGPDDEEAFSTQRALVSLLREPVPLYTAWHHGPDPSDREYTRSWVFVDGHWRLLGSTPTLFDAPAIQQHLARLLGYPHEDDPARARFPETTEGLVALVDALFASVARGDHALTRHYLGSLHLPHPEAWHRAVFVDPDATFTGPTGRPTTLLRDHRERDQNLDSEVEQVLRARRADLEVRALCLTDRSRSPERGPMATRRPCAFYALQLRHHRRDDAGMGLLPFVFVAGAWRLLGGLWNLESVTAKHLYAMLS
jgi:hypothetical protein